MINPLLSTTSFRTFWGLSRPVGGLLSHFKCSVWILKFYSIHFGVYLLYFTSPSIVLFKAIKDCRGLLKKHLNAVSFQCFHGAGSRSVYLDKLFPPSGFPSLHLNSLSLSYSKSAADDRYRLLSSVHLSGLFRSPLAWYIYSPAYCLYVLLLLLFYFSLHRATSSS